MITYEISEMTLKLCLDKIKHAIDVSSDFDPEEYFSYVRDLQWLSDLHYISVDAFAWYYDALSDIYYEPVLSPCSSAFAY